MDATGWRGAAADSAASSLASRNGDKAGRPRSRTRSSAGAVYVKTDYRAVRRRSAPRPARAALLELADLVHDVAHLRRVGVDVALEFGCVEILDRAARRKKGVAHPG